MLCRTAHRKPYSIWNVLNCDNFGRDGETQHFGRENPPPQEMSRKNAVLRVRACVNSTVSFTCWRQKLSGYVWCLSQNSDTICGLQLHVCAVYLKQHSNSTSTEWCVGTFIKRHWHGTDGQISLNQSINQSINRSLSVTLLFLWVPAKLFCFELSEALARGQD